MQKFKEYNQTLAPSNNITPDNGVFHVILPGLKGGGRNLTGLREHIASRGWVAASLSTRVGLKKGLGVYNLKAHYNGLAQELITHARGRVIRIYAHSLGGIEVLYLMKALARQTNLPYKSLEVIFISPPGIGQKGFSGLFRVGQRLVRVIRNLGFYDQQSLLPVSACEDNQVNLQRKLFLEEWLPHLVSSPLKREKFRQDLEAIDNKLLLPDKFYKLSDEEMLYLRQRHKLLKELVVKILCGEHIAEEKHQQYLRKYHELASDIAPTLAYLLTITIFSFMVLFNLYQGIDRKILAVYENCRQLKINTKVGVVILGRDDLVQIQDYAGFTEMAAKLHVPVYNFVFEDEEHSSVAYKWGLIDSLEEIKL